MMRDWENRSRTLSRSPIAQDRIQGREEASGDNWKTIAVFQRHVSANDNEKSFEIVSLEIVYRPSFAARNSRFRSRIWENRCEREPARATFNASQMRDAQQQRAHRNQRVHRWEASPVESWWLSHVFPRTRLSVRPSSTKRRDARITTLSLSLRARFALDQRLMPRLILLACSAKGCRG